MTKTSQNIGWSHQLSDDLQIEKVPHIFLDDGKKTLRDDLDALMEPILSNFHSQWTMYGVVLHNNLYL